MVKDSLGSYLSEASGFGEHMLLSLEEEVYYEKCSNLAQQWTPLG